MPLQVAVELEPGDSVFFREPGTGEQPAAADHLLQEPAARWQDTGEGREEKLRPHPLGASAVWPGQLNGFLMARGGSMLQQPGNMQATRQPRQRLERLTLQSHCLECDCHLSVARKMLCILRKCQDTFFEQMKSCPPSHKSSFLTPLRFWQKLWNLSPENAPTH